MDRLPNEILILIVEYACSAVPWRSARRVGLVSKRFRVIAEPIELRYIVVSGLAQLKSVVARLEGASESNGANDLIFQGKRIETQHLFVSELVEQHALSAETRLSSGNDYNCAGFWNTKEGKALAGMYVIHADEFWAFAAVLIKHVSSTLRSLSLLTSDTWFMGEVPFFDDPACPKILGALSGLSFPRLIRLTVVHDVNSEKSAFSEDWPKFQPPATPLLRHLYVESSIFLDGVRHEEMRSNNPHPLLADLQTERPQLNRLFLSDYALTCAETRAILFGASSGEPLASRRKLPGSLQSVIVQQGATPKFHTEEDVDLHRRASNVFEWSHNGLKVDGLGVRRSRKRFSGPGQRHYEFLLGVWKGGCLEPSH